MKNFLTLTCLLLLQTAIAQNWEVIQPGVNSKFQGGGLLHAVSTLSVKTYH